MRDGGRVGKSFLFLTDYIFNIDFIELEENNLSIVKKFVFK